jgi:hypothetical protein|tara:strand:+ start:1378 stop:2292 length:915 start_codon:yes stop_codon:yes gene_type:complete
MSSIQTNISLTAPQKEYFQRFVDLAVNDAPLPQGDGMIRISPFDDYFLFTLFDEVDGEDTPIDLSNVGDIYINFIGSFDEIDIINHTQVEEVDLSRGEVLFRITRSDSKKILALDNNNFYISTKMIDVTDGSISDESVLYQGIWLAVDDASRRTLTSQIEEQRLEYSILLAKLQEDNNKLLSENAALVTSAEEDTLAIQTLQASNNELINEIAELTKDLESADIELINRNASLAQALADKQIRSKQQIDAIARRTIPAANQQTAFFQQAARNLQQYVTGYNVVGTPYNFRPDDRFRADNNERFS